MLRPKITVHSEVSHEPMKGRLCRADTTRCKVTTNFAKETPSCCVGHNLTVFSNVVSYLDGLDVPWSIDYGSLLGWATNGRFYWNDKDCDVAVLSVDRHRIVTGMQYFLDRGFHSYYTAPNPKEVFKHSDILKVQRSRANRNSTDITFWDVDPSGVMVRKNWAKSDRYKGREFPKDRMFPTTRGIFHGIEVNIPKDPFWLVEHRYGPGWRELPAVRFVRKERESEYAAA